MKALLIQCPHCKETSELYLASQPSMMVLNCPLCQATLMHLDGKTHQLDSQPIANLQKNSLHEYAENFRKNDTASSTLKYLPPPITSKSHFEKKPSHKMGESVRDSAVNSDDILNLKIDLAKCHSVEEFMDVYFSS